MKFKFHIYKILGNFGVSFFTPITGTGISNMITQDPIGLVQALYISGITSVFVTGISIMKELKEYGETEGKH